MGTCNEFQVIIAWQFRFVFQGLALVSKALIPLGNPWKPSKIFILEVSADIEWVLYRLREELLSRISLVNLAMRPAFPKRHCRSQIPG